MTEKTIQILLLIGIAASASGCRAQPQSDCAKHIKDEIAPGLRSDLAEAQLKKCGFETTLDPAKKSLYGDKRVRDGVVFERTQVVINLSADDTVRSVSVSTELIGP
jgi:hypothetical protein